MFLKWQKRKKIESAARIEFLDRATDSGLFLMCGLVEAVTFSDSREGKWLINGWEVESKAKW